MLTIKVFNDDDDRSHLQMAERSVDLYLGMHEIDNLAREINKGRMTDLDEVLNRMFEIITESKYHDIDG